ncbi:16S rRNA (cytidine(1402)-2'-O)-methyltransferase [bacterium]|nr:16S rRNA (cytidine(1402)-2'-O)-methyltransferase [bacterium]
MVSTPIGNLEDMTMRGVRILGEVSLIAAEDTRHTAILLKQYAIKTHMQAYHDHNKEKVTPLLIRRLSGGDSLAVVSDAGTPGISDPAFYLVREAVRHDIRVIPVPGPSAALACLVVSGLPTDRFVFEGFLPVKKGRRTRLESLKEEQRTIIIYESPHRILRTLTDLREILGDRQVCVGREITKKFEEMIRGSLSWAIDCLSRDRVRGEFVITLQGSVKEKRKTP